MRIHATLFLLFLSARIVETGVELEKKKKTQTSLLPATGGPADRSPGDRQPEGIRDPVPGRAAATGTAELRAVRRSESQRGETAPRAEGG